MYSINVNIRVFAMTYKVGHFRNTAILTMAKVVNIFSSGFNIFHCKGWALIKHLAIRPGYMGGQGQLKADKLAPISHVRYSFKFQEIQ